MSVGTILRRYTSHLSMLISSVTPSFCGDQECRNGVSCTPIWQAGKSLSRGTALFHNSCFGLCYTLIPSALFFDWSTRWPFGIVRLDVVGSLRARSCSRYVALNAVVLCKVDSVSCLMPVVACCFTTRVNVAELYSAGFALSSYILFFNLQRIFRLQSHAALCNTATVGCILDYYLSGTLVYCALGGTLEQARNCARHIQDPPLLGQCKLVRCKPAAINFYDTGGDSLKTQHALS